MVDVLLTDPKQLLTMLQAGIALGVTFGLPISAQQMGALFAFFSAFIIWLNSQQPTPKELEDFTNAAEGAVKAMDIQVSEVTNQAASVIEANKP